MFYSPNNLTESTSTFQLTAVLVAIYINESIWMNLTWSTDIFSVSFRLENREGEIGGTSRRAVRERLRLKCIKGKQVNSSSSRQSPVCICIRVMDATGLHLSRAVLMRCSVGALR